MALTEQQKEIALRVAQERYVSHHGGTGDGIDFGNYAEFAERFLAALPKPEAVGHQYQDEDGKWCNFINQKHYENTLADGTWMIRPIYTESPITPPASEQKPVAYLVSIEGEPELGHWFAETNTAVPGVLYKPLYLAPQPDYKAQRDALLKAVAQVKSNLMHHRRFGDDTFQAWKNAAARAEGDLEEAIASVKGGA